MTLAPEYLEKIRRILIVKLGAIGDIVHTLPVLKILKSANHSSHITWIVEKKSGEILANCNEIDRIITINTREWRKKPGLNSVRQILRLINSLKNSKFDLVLDFQGLFKSGIITYLTSSPLRYGFESRACKEWINSLFTNRKFVVSDTKQHIVEINLDAIKSVGYPLFRTNYHIPVSNYDHSYIDSFLKKYGLNTYTSIIAINPAAGRKTKQWDLIKFRELCRRILDSYIVKLLITWGPGEKELAEKISDGLGPNAVIAPPTTISQFTTLINRCCMLIGGDTGPLHIAAANRIPTLAIYGSTDPVRNGPYGNKNVVIYKNLDCRNCYSDKCKTIDCMEKIGVEEVFQGFESLYRTYKFTAKTQRTQSV